MEIGDKCPLFKGLNQHKELVKAADFIGKKKMVIFFYPKDFTPGCTKEACSFRDNYEIFKEHNCEVIGISGDTSNSHEKFAEKYDLEYHLVSDDNKQIRKAFEVPKSLFGLIPGRVTYIVDTKGVIQGIFNSQSDPFGHINAALEKVKEIQ